MTDGSAELKANGQATGCCYRPGFSVRPDPDPSVVAEGSGPDGTGRRGRHRRSGSSIYSRKFDLTDPCQFRCPAALWVPSVARRRHQKRLRRFVCVGFACEIEIDRAAARPVPSVARRRHQKRLRLRRVPS